MACCFGGSRAAELAAASRAGRLEEPPQERREAATEPRVDEVRDRVMATARTPLESSPPPLSELRITPPPVGRAAPENTEDDSAAAADDASPSPETPPTTCFTAYPPFIDGTLETMCVHQEDLNALPTLAKHIWKQGEMLFLALESEAPDSYSGPFPDHAIVAEILGRCEQEHFTSERVFEAAAEKIGCDRSELSAKFGSVEYKNEIRAAFFTELDTWAETTFSIDMDNFDGSVWYLLEEKTPGIHNLGEIKRHDSLSLWFEALNLTIARKDSIEKPSHRSFFPPVPRELEAGEVPAALVGAVEQAQTAHKALSRLLSTLACHESSCKDIERELEIVDTSFPARGFKTQVLKHFARGLGIPSSMEEDVERILSYPKFRESLKRSVAETAYFFTRMSFRLSNPEDARRKGEPEEDSDFAWIDQVFKASARAAGLATEEDEWVDNHRFDPNIPQSHLWKAIIERLKQKYAA